jgi:YVTN family beta-propeller protein
VRLTRSSCLPWLLAGSFLTACEVLNPPDGRDTSCVRPAVRAAPAGGSHPDLSSVQHVPLSGAPSAVTVAPDGAVFVTRAGTIVRAASGTTAFTTELAFADGALQLRLSANGQTAYLNHGYSGYVSFIDVANSQVIEKVHVTGRAILSLGLSPDGGRLYVLTDFDGLIVLDTDTRRSIDTIPPDSAGLYLSGVAFHPFSPCMYITAREAGKVRTVDLRSNAVVRIDSVIGGRLENVAVSRDGGELYATDIGRSQLHIFDLQGGSRRPVATLPVGSGAANSAFDVAVTPDNTQVLVTALLDSKVYVYARAARALIDSVFTDGTPGYIGFTSGGAGLVVPNQAGWVTFAPGGGPPDVCVTPAVGSPPAGAGHPDLSNHETVPLGGTPWAAAISPTGVTYVTQLERRTASRVDLPSSTFGATVPVGPVPTQIKMSPDGQTVYVSNEGNAFTIRVISVVTNQPVDTIRLPKGSIQTIGVSPDGTRLWALTDTAGAYIIDTGTREIVDSISRFSVGPGLTGVAFHPFSPCVYLAGDNVAVVNTQTLRVARQLFARNRRMRNIAITPDGATLFGMDPDRGILVSWELASGSSASQERVISLGYVLPFDVAVTPDNTQVYITTLERPRVYVLDRFSRMTVDSLITNGVTRRLAFTASGTGVVVPNGSDWVTFSPAGVTPPGPCAPPMTGSPAPGAGHPTLLSHQTVPLGNQPLGVAITQTGVVYVTQFSAGTAVRTDLPSISFGTPFSVGNVPSQIRMHPNGQTAFVSNQHRGTVSVVDVATNQVIDTVTVPAGSVQAIGMSPDGNRLYVLTDIAGAYIIDTGTRAIVGNIAPAITGDLLTGIAFHPFSPCVYLAAHNAGTITVFNTQTLGVVRRYAVAGTKLQSLAVSHDGATLFATDALTGKLLSWDLISGSATAHAVQLGRGGEWLPFDVAVTPDNAQVYVSTTSGGKIFIVDRVTRMKVDSVVTGGDGRYIGFSADGLFAVIANSSGWVDFLH